MPDELDDTTLKPVMPIDLKVICEAYGWTIDINGQVCGLVAGDMGYDETGIVIPIDHLLALLLKDHEKEEDLPGYKAGFAAAIDKAAMLHVSHADSYRQSGQHIDAEVHMEWVRRIRGLGEK